MITAESIIKRSTFSISSKAKIVDAFLTPDCKIVKLKSHHHVEVALEILKKLDDELQEKYDCVNSWLSQSIAILFELENSKISNYNDLGDVFRKHDRLYDSGMHTYYDPDLKLISKEVSNLIGRERESIESYERRLKEIKPKHISNFKLANKNRGYDAAEYAIITLGYIAIENGYIIYNPRKITRSQAERLACYKCTDEETGLPMLVQKTSAELKEEKKKLQEKCIKQIRYFEDFSHRFHCPSGFERNEFLRWIGDCSKCGLNGYDLITRANRF